MTRRTGPELLRMVAIFMVIILHYNSQAGLLPEAGIPLKAGQFPAAIAEGLCIVSLNTWVLISGYFMTEKSYRPGRLVELMFEIYFYLFLGYGIALATGATGIQDLGGAYGILQKLFPISSGAYWFMSAYVIVYILSPVLCAGINSLTRGKLRVVILSLMFFHVAVKSLIPVRFAMDRAGYDFSWFLVLFMIAGYIRRYGIRMLRLSPFGEKGDTSSDRKVSLKGFVLYLVCGLMLGILTLIFHTITLRTGMFMDYMRVFYEHNFILLLISSIGLFIWFLMMDVPEGRMARAMRFLAPSVTGIYLLHEHPEIRGRWLSWLVRVFGDVPADNTAALTLHVLICAVTVFAAGLVVDLIRRMIFYGIRNGLNALMPGRRK